MLAKLTRDHRADTFSCAWVLLLCRWSCPNVGHYACMPADEDGGMSSYVVFPSPSSAAIGAADGAPAGWDGGGERDGGRSGIVRAASPVSASA